MLDMTAQRRVAGGEGDTENDRDLLRIQELLHGLICSRAREGGIAIPRRLPKLDRAMADEVEPRWFPVPGMSGGFAYALRREGVVPVLHVESWSRVVDGFNLRHHVHPSQVILVEQGMAWCRPIPSSGFTRASPSHRHGT
ncbi:MAG: hypothetical protein MUD17_10560 [Gemmatimonadaceae bacterium]|jgi:hypothetical protein|nr:hypothetical protein [Gemmatimonadaceae bacterium]